MAILSSFELDHVYFFEYDGDSIIGMYIEDYEYEFQEKFKTKRFEELWCNNLTEKELIYTTFVNSETINDINVLKHLGHIDEKYSNEPQEQILEELKQEFPEYFI